jgi:hypothetical protein
MIVFKKISNILTQEAILVRKKSSKQRFATGLASVRLDLFERGGGLV